jgi:hypothetical protein
VKASFELMKIRVFARSGCEAADLLLSVVADVGGRSRSHHTRDRLRMSDDRIVRQAEANIRRARHLPRILPPSPEQY